MKHTPGPWRMNTRGDLPIYAGDAPNHELVAVALKGESQEANARLIAAAPELFACLKDALERGDIASFAVPDARAAIAKVEGRE